MSISAHSPKQNPFPPGHGRSAPTAVLVLATAMAAVTGHFTDWQTAATVFNSVLALYNLQPPQLRGGCRPGMKFSGSPFAPSTSPCTPSL